MRKVVIAALCALALLGALAAYKLLSFGPARLVVSVEPGPAQPRVSAAEAGIDPAGLEAAAEYAARRNTTALVVARGGHIVFEKYWGEGGAESLVQFDELSPVLAALLLGTALNDRLVLDLDMPLTRYLPGDVSDQDSRTLRTLLVAEDAETLALVLERLTRQPYTTLLVDRLWKPLGNGDLSFAVRSRAPRKGEANAACCVRARIGDWMRVGQMLVRDGVFEANQYTPPGFVASMLRKPRQDSLRGNFLRWDGTFATRDVAWIGGAGHQRVWLVPSLDLVILRTGEDPGAEGWDEAMIPDDIIRGTRGWQPGNAGQGTDPSRFAPH